MRAPIISRASSASSWTVSATQRRCHRGMIKSKSKHKSPSAVFLFAVPELTRRVGIQRNERVSLRRPIEILSSIQSRGLANAASTGHAYRAIRGRCCVIEGSGPAQSCLDGKLDDAATPLDPLDRDGRMLDSLARNSFEFCFCG